MRKRLVILVAGLCLAASLGLVLAGQLRQSGPFLASAPIGNGIGLGAWLPVDQQTGRAYLLDDGVIDQMVTLTPGGGYTPPYYIAINTTVHVLDTRTGRIVAALPVSDSAEDLAVDPYTRRLFVMDHSDGLQAYDTRSERLLNTLPWASNASIDAVLADPRTSHLLLTTSVEPGPAAQQMLMLDGYTGRVLHRVVFPHGPRVVEKQLNGNGSSFSYYLSSLTMALDTRAGRLYVFNRGQTMSVLDSASGRLLYTRRLPVPVAGAQVDDSAGHIFAFDASHNSAVMGGTIIDRRHTPLHPGTVLMLDAHSGTTLRRVPGGTTRSGVDQMSIDRSANRVLVLNASSDTVSTLDGASGKLLRTVATGGAPYQLVLDARHHRAALLVSAGLSGASRRIVILDTRSGKLLRAISLAQDITGLAVDPSSGHLLVTTSALLPIPGDRWSWLPGWLRDRLPGLPPPPPTPDPSQRILHNAVSFIDLP